jgi:hypothetical protein
VALAVIVSAAEGCTVEVPITSLDQGARRVSAVRAIGLRAKLIERGQRARRRDLENRSTTVSLAVAGALDPAAVGGAVQIAVCPLDEAAFRPFTIGAVRFCAEAIEGNNILG